MLQNEIEINEQTPIAMCTVGQFLGFLRSNGVLVEPSMLDPERDTALSVKDGYELSEQSFRESRKIYGLRGIMSEFHCGKTTAVKYTKGIFKDIIKKEGRKIALDADDAWRVFGLKSKKTPRISLSSTER